MNPFMAIYSMMLKLRRTCPVCKKEQIVPASKKDQTVSCNCCGTPLPPPKDSR
jgi:ribosomal protein S27E